MVAFEPTERLSEVLRAGLYDVREISRGIQGWMIFVSSLS